MISNQTIMIIDSIKHNDNDENSYVWLLLTVVATVIIIVIWCHKTW